jgi:hypothetical protein
MSDSPSDRVVIEGISARAVSPEGKEASMNLASLFAAAAPRMIDTCGLILPRGTLLVSSRGPWTIVVNETPPLVFRLRWIDEKSRARYGPGTRYAQIRIALPYVIIVAVFHNGVLSHANECFFRTEPITCESDLLSYPALLNCSRFEPQDGKPLAWICTQNLDPQTLAEKPLNERTRVGFQALRHCLFETGFNESSEFHEGSSWYTESKRVDQRIGSMQAWEKATEKDALFVLEVPWLPTGLSVAQVVERIFRNQHAAAKSVATAGDVARIIFNQAP